MLHASKFLTEFEPIHTKTIVHEGKKHPFHAVNGSLKTHTRYVKEGKK